MLLLLLACNPRPGATQNCADSAVLTDATDETLGFSAEAALTSVGTGRVALWSATGEDITLAYGADSGDVEQVTRTDGKDGGCGRTGDFLRVPVQVAVTADEVSGLWRGSLAVWALTDADMSLEFGAVDQLDVSADLESEVEDLSGGADADATAYAAWLSGTVAAGSLRVEADVTWGGYDTGEAQEDTYTLLDGSWAVESG